MSKDNGGKNPMRAGVIGLGDMGSGLAKNLLANEFQVTGYDLSEKRMKAFADMGGKPAGSVAEVGENADAVYVMVMNGDQTKSVIFGQKEGEPQNKGLLDTMDPGGAIILTATIKPAEARSIGQMMAGQKDHSKDQGIALIDSPVSGGFPGAQGGTLTMMAAAEGKILDKFAPVMEAVSGTIHRVGEKPGEGQTVKACLQSLIGAIFSATFEAAVLAAKAGVKGEVLHKVVSTSSASCGVANNALEKIIDRAFEGTGSHISTMHKDLTIALSLAEELGVPLHTASTAMQLFHAGKTKYPQGDNWVVTRVLEEIVGVELHR